MTDFDVLNLLLSGKYNATSDGSVYGQRGNKLPTFKGSKVGFEYLFVRLYNRTARQRCGITVAKIVWMAFTKSLVPANFEIHHRDGDIYNNAWDNLLCLHKLRSQEVS
jgi:hypothetical protein